MADRYAGWYRPPSGDDPGLAFDPEAVREQAAYLTATGRTYTEGESIAADDTTGVPSYHDLYITTAQIPRTRLFDLPYGLEVICNRTTGWRLYHVKSSQPMDAELLAGEYDGPESWLVLDVAGHVIVDSRPEAASHG